MLNTLNTRRLFSHVWRWLAVFGLIAWFASARAESVVRDRPFFQASRALAMGDAYTAYNVGFEAVYYNPAGVARRNPMQVKYIDVELTGSQAMFSFLSKSFSSLGSLGKIAQNVAANPGQVQAMGISFLPQFIARNFSLGLVAQSYTEALVDPVSKDLDFYGTTDLALYMQYGVALYGGIIKIGVGLKALDRAEVNRTYTESEYLNSGLSFGSQWKEGIGYGADAGLMITAPVASLPTFALAVQDIGDTALRDRRLIFTGSSGMPGAPAPLKQHINTGYAMTVKHAPGVKSGFSFEFKDVGHITDNYLERFHAGWELNFQNAVAIRAGVNQGRYWTAGLGLHLSNAALELATYGENLLVYTGQRRDDRKYVARYVLTF